MNKDNVFCSSPFYMGVGDTLHLLFVDETGTEVEVELSGDEDNYAPSAPTATAATSITETGFTANWMFNENTTGYYLDVATDIGFTSLVAGFSNHDAGNANSHAITGLTGATPYYYRVRAYNDYGTSPNSNIITTNTILDVLYGAFYNWYAATYAIAGTSIAPTGWHVPTDIEWLALMLFIDPDGTQSVNDAGKKLKEIGTDHWTASAYTGTDDYGLKLIGSGIRSGTTGVFNNIKIAAAYHMISTYDNVVPISATQNWQASVGNYWDLLIVRLGQAGSLALKTAGLSIRCILDGVDPANPGTVTDVDGNIYPTVKIGTQVWMAQDLKVTHYRDGTLIPLLSDSSQWIVDTSGAMCWYNNITP